MKNGEPSQEHRGIRLSRGSRRRGSEQHPRPVPKRVQTTEGHKGGRRGGTDRYTERKGEQIEWTRYWEREPAAYELESNEKSREGKRINNRTVWA